MTVKADDVATVKNQFLMCREKGHQWRHLNDEISEGSKRAVKEVARQWNCPTCGTEMTEWITVPAFEIRRRKYAYPDGYLFDIPAMGGRVLRPEIRREQFRRLGFKF